MSDYKKNIIAKAFFVKELGESKNNIGLVDDANAVIDFVKSQDFDTHNLLQMESYRIVNRVYHR